MNIDKIIKKMKLLFLIGILSIVFSIIFEISKISVTLVFSEKSESILSIVFPSAIFLGLKLYFKIPILNKLDKLIKNNDDNDLSILKKIYKLNKIFLIINIVILFLMFANRNNWDTNSTKGLIILILPFLATSISLVFDIVNMSYSKELMDNYGIKR